MMLGLRLVRLATAAWLIVAAAGCSSLYDEADNWVIENNDIPEYFAEYDVFYLYPSSHLSSRSLQNGDPAVHRANPDKYLNWLKDGVSEDLRRNVVLPLSRQFGPRVRLFSPLVPQVCFNDYNELLKKAEAKEWRVDWSDTSLNAAIEYTVEALKWYIGIKDSKHPFILLGHGQGALILYEAMKRCSAVKPGNGFVAAYFFGLPGVTPERIIDDFGGRGIKPATDRDDPSVVAVCNIRVPGCKPEETFALRGGAVINPINWHTTALPTSPQEHPGAVFFDRTEVNPSKQVVVHPKFCGAVVDPENALVNVTQMSAKVKLPLAPRSYRSQLWGMFALCVSRNARDRVRVYKFERKGLKLPDVD